MVELNDYPPGVPCWVDTLQPDVEGAMRFYGDLMGWTFEGPGEMPDLPSGRYYVARLRGRDVAGIGTRPSEVSETVWNTYVSVQSAEDTARRARNAGGQVLEEPFDALPAGRIAVLADPAGAVFCAWEPHHRKGAELANEIGAWAMNALSTPDPEGAKKFYADVFGWRSEPLKMNGGEITLFRLPGYVGGLPEQPVPRDNVAVLVPADAGGPLAGARPRWDVGFWIADADAAAEKTLRAGGKVVVPPFEIPRFRQAVLADPQGAVFTVAQPRAKA